jgi:hypothetical protein
MKLNLKDTAIGSIVAVDKEAEVRIEATINVKGRTSASSIILIRDLDFEKVDSIWAKFFMHFLVIKLAVVDMQIKQTHFSLEKHF